MAANLNLVGTETQVNLNPHQNGFQSDPDAVALSDGDFVVAYEDDNGIGSKISSPTASTPTVARTARRSP